MFTANYLFYIFTLNIYMLAIQDLGECDLHLYGLLTQEPVNPVFYSIL